jgi:hypothetical protein
LLAGSVTRSAAVSGFDVGVAVGAGVGDAVGCGTTVGETVAVGVAVAVGDGVAVGVGSGVPHVAAADEQSATAPPTLPT